jgi:hypothetical protein
MELVVSPVLHAYAYGGVPPVGDAVKTALLPEQMLGLDDEMVTPDIHWPYPRMVAKRRRRNTSKLFFIGSNSRVHWKHLVWRKTVKFHLNFKNSTNGTSLFCFNNFRYK